MFVHNILDHQELTSLYAANDYYELPNESVQRIVKESNRRLKSLIKHKPGGSYFEIGCAKGLQLDQAKALGFKTFGTELSSANVAVCKKNGHMVINGYLNDFVPYIPKNGFDIISCLDVIEHVDNPIDFILLATSMLSSDGVMVISTPNYSGFVAKILGARDPFLTPPEHLNFFTLEGMRYIFQATGLQELKRITFGTLTKSESGRVYSKYIHLGEKNFAPIFQFLIPIGTHILNKFKLGLEQEIYLKKQKPSNG